MKLSLCAVSICSIAVLVCSVTVVTGGRMGGNRHKELSSTSTTTSTPSTSASSRASSSSLSQPSIKPQSNFESTDRNEPSFTDATDIGSGFAKNRPTSDSSGFGGNSGTCKLSRSEPSVSHDSIRILSTPKNRAALQLGAHLVFSNGQIAIIEPTSVEYENTRHWEILKVKSPCADVDLLFTNSSVFKQLAFGHVEIRSFNGPLSREKPCMFHTPSEDKRSRFANGLECLRERNYNCNDDYGESSKPVATFKLRTLRVEFNRNLALAPRNGFESPVSEFVKCKSREEIEEKLHQINLNKQRHQASTSGPLISSFGRSTTGKPLKFSTVASDEESGIESSDDIEVSPPPRSSRPTRPKAIATASA